MAECGQRIEPGLKHCLQDSSGSSAYLACQLHLCPFWPSYPAPFYLPLKEIWAPAVLSGLHSLKILCFSISQPFLLVFCLESACLTLSRIILLTLHAQGGTTAPGKHFLMTQSGFLEHPVLFPHSSCHCYSGSHCHAELNSLFAVCPFPQAYSSQPGETLVHTCILRAQSSASELMVMKWLSDGTENHKNCRSQLDVLFRFCHWLAM